MARYARFEVQAQDFNGNWFTTSPKHAEHGKIDAAVAYARTIVGMGYPAVRVWGYHATIRGGFGNRVVWDSRDNG